MLPKLPIAVVLVTLLTSTAAVMGPVGVNYFVSENDTLKPLSSRMSLSFLGGENRKIAQSIRCGQGFSSPFGIPDTPTSWHGPLYPMLVATALYLTQDRLETAGLLLLSLNSVILFWILLDVLRISIFRRYWIVTLTSFCVVIWSNYWYTVLQTNDGFIQLALVSWLVSVFVIDRPAERSSMSMGLCGGFCGLVSPILLLVWGWLMLSDLWKLGMKRTFIAAALTAALIAPWTMRNVQQFGKLIPTKSNLGFEVQQSLCDCPLGVSDHTTPNHPSSDRQQALLHSQLGESQYLQAKWLRGYRCFQDDPSKMMFDIVYRAACVSIWKHSSQNEYRNVSGLSSAICYGLPLTSLGLMLLYAKRPIAPWMKRVLVIYAIYSVPYVLISFNLRYSVPLTGVKAMVLSYVLSHFLQRWGEQGPESHHDMKTDDVLGSSPC